MDKNVKMPKRPRAIKQRRANIALIAVFAAFISSFFVLICVLPKHEGELSPNERRMLAEAPKFSFDNFFSGGFAEDVETWLEDHFPARNFFVSLYSYVNRMTGRNTTEDIVLGKNDRLFPAPVPAGTEETAESNGKRISDFIAANGLKAYVALVPSSGYMLENELPALHLEYHDDVLIDSFENRSGLDAYSTKIDVEALFKAQPDPSAMYYRTDHHITMRGTYALYTLTARSLGFEPVPEAEFNKTQYEFYGTSYGGSGLAFTRPDTLETWLLPNDNDIEVTTTDGKKVESYNGTLDTACLDASVVDKYAAYLYSNHGLTSVINPNVAEDTLLVLKDSFGNALVPFLASHYHEIIMLDMRYYSSGMELPSDIVKRLGITDMLVIYGTDSAATLRELTWLR